jgi:hypothetical protein
MNHQLLLLLVVLVVATSSALYYYTNAVDGNADTTTTLKTYNRPPGGEKTPDHIWTTAKKVKIWKQLFHPNDTYSPLLQCNPTSQIRVLIYNDSSSVILETYDEFGTKKTEGGDELYVVYRDYASDSSSKSTHVAFVEDRNDGTYELVFSTTPLHRSPRTGNLTVTGALMGSMTIHVEFTCGIGYMHAPFKDTWFTGGTSGLKFRLDNVPLPNYETFQPPPELVHLFSKYKLVLSFGDSIQKQFAREKSGRMYHDKLLTMANADSAGPTHPVNVPRLLQELEKWHGHEFQNIQKGEKALVLGAAAWDLINPINATLLGNHFRPHLQGIRDYIQGIRQKYSSNLTIYWKLPYALHPLAIPVKQCVVDDHCVNCVQARGCRFMIRYLSRSRSRRLYDLQKELLQELNVTTLDFWNTSYLSGERTMKGDARHYSPAFNEMLVQWLF